MNIENIENVKNVKIENIKNYEYILEALSGKSGDNILFMDLEGLGALADNFILVTGNSEVHLKTLTEATEEAFEKHGVKCSVEGAESSNWRLVDAGDIIVHVFSRKGREFYRLEKLWDDAKTFEYSGYNDDKFYNFDNDEI